jgi:hypothetical protein
VFREQAKNKTGARRFEAMLKDEQIKVLMGMYDLEKSIGELYALFSEKFPEHGGLWNQLSREERGHAEAVRKLYQVSYEGQSIFKECSIKVEAVRSVIDHVKTTHDLATRGKVSALKALTTTYDLENSLLEKTIFTHFKVTAQYADVLETLHRETQKHALMAKREMEALPQSA